MDIDSAEEEEEGVYVYVSGGDLTPEATREVRVVESWHHLPCRPSHPGVDVSLTSGCRHLSSMFTYSPRAGFASPSPPPHLASCTCSFHLGGKTESLQLVLRTGRQEVLALPVTLHGAASVPLWGDLVLDCKVVTPSVARVVWQVVPWLLST